MIDRDSAVSSVIDRLYGLPVGGCLDVRSYKRNRSVAIARTHDHCFEILERGFEERLIRCDRAELKKILKTVFNREFPRSTRLRLYVLADAEAIRASAMARKIL